MPISTRRFKQDPKNDNAPQPARGRRGIRGIFAVRRTRPIFDLSLFIGAVQSSRQTLNVMPPPIAMKGSFGESHTASQIATSARTGSPARPASARAVLSRWGPAPEKPYTISRHSSHVSDGDIGVAAEWLRLDVSVPTATHPRLPPLQAIAPGWSARRPSPQRPLTPLAARREPLREDRRGSFHARPRPSFPRSR